MTCIAARVYDHEIKMSADSMLSSRWTRTDGGEFSKIFQCDGALIGLAGIAGVGGQLEIFSRTNKINTIGGIGSVLDWVVAFADWRKTKVGVWGIGECALLVAHETGLFAVSEDLSIIEHRHFFSIGCGQDFAMAAMHLGHTAHDAVLTACNLSAFCGQPVLDFSLQLKRENEK